MKTSIKLFSSLLFAFLSLVSRGQLPDVETGNLSAEVQTVATGLASPIDVVSAHDGTGRLFIVEQGGRIRILKNGALNATPFLDISGQIKFGGEQGLLGLAFHPGFSTAGSPGFGKFYTFATETPNGAADFTVPKSSAFANQVAIAEWQVSMGNPDVADPVSRRPVLRIDHPAANHNAGKIVFRPSDGYLYIAMGDGGDANDVGDGHTPTIGNAQDKTTLLGKILRIDPLLPAANPGSADPISSNARYRVPADNPFSGTSGLREIYAYGFRNPYRFSVDANSDRVIAGDVGQGSIEEVDIVTKGGNYGWHRKEGTFLFNSASGSVSVDPNPDPSLTSPVLEYDHGDGISVIGGFVYRGTALSALTGKYVFGDYFYSPNDSGRLFQGDLDTGTIQELRIGGDPRPLGYRVKGFGEDAQHELYVVADNDNGTGGRILKIVPIPAAPALLNLSSRARVQADADGSVIAGFIITGSVAKKVVVRGRGPSLEVNGQAVPGRLENPTLSLFDSSNNSIATNDDWQSTPGRQELMDLNLAPTEPLESALLMTLPPGGYTAILSGVGNTAGVGLVELYDVSSGVSANAVNLSTRARVQTDDDILIGGLIVGGTQTQRVIFRAIGPSLTARGVAGALGDPTLELVNSSGMTIAYNDDWRSDQATEISATGLAPSNDAESAIIRTLAPDSYTAIVRGANNTTGIGLVEVYRLNP